ncbi:MAG: GIY-YIG nuclease family protein [Terracidiphilus sp.]
MACVYVLRQDAEDIFKIGRTKGSVTATIEQLSRGNPCRLTELARIETEDDVACETFLHQRLRSRRVVQGGGREFFRISPQELNEAIRDAKEFVSEYLSVKSRAEEMSELETDAQFSPVKPTREDLDIYTKLLNVRESQDRLKVQRDFFESKLKLSIGRACSLEGVATWKGQWNHRFDVSAFREAEVDLYAELYRRFGADSYSRRFLIQRFE